MQFKTQLNLKTSLYFITKFVPESPLNEGFQGGSQDELVSGAVDEKSGVIKYLDNSELYDDFYA